jgi:hypothetical protein
MEKIGIEDARTDIEKVMMGLDPGLSEKDHRIYLGGYIDRMFAEGSIDWTDRNILYLEYSI